MDKEIKESLKDLPAEEKAKINFNKELVLYEGGGCGKCRNTGYKGRAPIAEIFTITDDLKKIISEGFDHERVKKEMIHRGMVNMRQDGFLKALDGVTTVAEVFRVMQE